MRQASRARSETVSVVARAHTRYGQCSSQAALINMVGMSMQESSSGRVIAAACAGDVCSADSVPQPMRKHTHTMAEPVVRQLAGGGAVLLRLLGGGLQALHDDFHHVSADVLRVHPAVPLHPEVQSNANLMPTSCACVDAQVRHKEQKDVWVIDNNLGASCLQTKKQH